VHGEIIFCPEAIFPVVWNSDELEIPNFTLYCIYLKVIINVMILYKGTLIRTLMYIFLKKKIYKGTLINLNFQTLIYYIY